jgi:hypothetical protein
MTKTILLAPHDPIPEPGAHGLVLRHLGEDNPVAIVTEIIFHGPGGGSIAAHRPDGAPMPLQEALDAALLEAKHRGIATIYVLDRTKGQREQEVLHAHGMHNFANDILSDTDPEDGVKGSDLRDRPHDAGFMR